MKLEELIEEIYIEFEFIQTIVEESLKLRDELIDKVPTTREKTAAGAFLAQFYNGIENILKRFYKYYGKSVQSGFDWHLTLFKTFCEPPEKNLPLLFPKTLRQN